MNGQIIAETADWVAIDKPAGLLSIPDRLGKETSLKEQLKNKYGEIFTVHRIDRDTSGVIVFAKTAEAHQHLSKLFEGRAVDAPLKNGTTVWYAAIRLRRVVPLRYPLWKIRHSPDV
jgi:23S rRNA-/tRNA-specific pseudouridylate synthase